MQYLTTDGRFSQVAFQQYDLPMDRLTADLGSIDQTSQSPSYELIGTALATGTWDPDVVKSLLRRSGEGLRVIARCAFIAGVAMFPTGRRRRGEFPIEIVVLGAAFVERAFTSYVVGPGVLGVASGSIVLLVAAAVILLVRLRMLWSGPRRAVAA